MAVGGVGVVARGEGDAALGGGSCGRVGRRFFWQQSDAQHDFSAVEFKRNCRRSPYPLSNLKLI